MTGKSRGTSFVVFLLACLFSPDIAAQTSYNLHEKGIERINEARSVAPLSVDTLFGDQTSHFDGSIAFTNIDISVPGNDVFRLN